VLYRLVLVLNCVVLFGTCNELCCIVCTLLYFWCILWFIIEFIFNCVLSLLQQETYLLNPALSISYRLVSVFVCSCVCSCAEGRYRSNEKWMLILNIIFLTRPFY
jgi:hypothetical protein